MLEKQTDMKGAAQQIPLNKQKQYNDIIMQTHNLRTLSPPKTFFFILLDSLPLEREISIHRS